MLVTVVLSTAALGAQAQVALLASFVERGSGNPVDTLTPAEVSVTEDGVAPQPRFLVRVTRSKTSADSGANRGLQFAPRVVLTRLGLLLLLVLIVTGRPFLAQQTGSAFEVASVKLHTSDDQQMVMTMRPGGRFVATNVLLRLVIRTTFQVQDEQIVGGPAWLDTDRFDINAKAPDNMRPEDIAPMLQALLTERFKLRTHREMRERPVLALERIRRDAPMGEGLRPTACPELAVDLSEPKPCANINNGVNFLTLRGAPIEVFAQYLAPYVNRVVVDRTGLDGRYDIVLKWSPEPSAGAGAPSPAAQDRPGLITALQEQLGLKLESTRAPLEVLVVDSVERPTPD